MSILTVTPVPIRVTWCQGWEMDTVTCPLLSISAAVQNQTCFGFSSLSVLGQVLLVFNPLPEFCRSRGEEEETEKKSSKFLLAKEL